MKVVKNVEEELLDFSLNPLKIERSKFDPIGTFNQIMGSHFKHIPHIKDHLENCVDDYKVKVKDYYIMDLDLEN